MFKPKNSFKQRNLNDMQPYVSNWDMLKEVFSLQNIIKIIVVLACVVAVLLLGKRLLVGAQLLTGHFTKDTVDTISRKLWEEMKRDDKGNVNVMLIGHGGANHAWWYLADSIMLASWNPELGAVTMVSIPRDLYVNASDYRIRGKINSVFAMAYYRSKDVSKIVGTWVNIEELGDEEKHILRMEYASKVMAEELEEISGLEIPYYAVVDFTEFESLIDKLWGIDIDVPSRLYDTAYPQGKSYVTFTVPKGINHFDGATALKYARSRHSTSDFDRSRRQQQIIQAVVDKLMEKENFNSVSKVRSLYEDYTKMVFTNISSQEILWMFKYANQIDNMFSFGLTTHCSNNNYARTNPGCFLYVPNRDTFGWASVLLPSGSSSSNVSFYDYINHFIFFIAHNQKFLMENPTIVVQNGIDKQVARNLGKQPSGHAGKMAVKMKKYGFDVINIENAPESIAETSLFVAGTGVEYPRTLDMMRMFLDVNYVYDGQDLGTGVDAILVIGNDYIEKMEGRFNYYK